MKTNRTMKLSCNPCLVTTGRRKQATHKSHGVGYCRSCAEYYNLRTKMVRINTEAR